MESLILGAILAFSITFYSIPAIINIARMKKLYDYPGERKIHVDPIPSLGGLAIFAGFILSLLVVADLSTVTANAQYIFASFIIVFFLGVKDDILVITPMKKFIGQVLIALLLIFKAKILISNMHGFLSLGIMDPNVSFLLTMFTMIVIMNAFNLIDGIDGLAACLSIVSASVFGMFFYLNGDTFYGLMSFCFVASMASFLIYNFPPAKIFMGDTGSILSGLINSILVIRFIETAENSKILPSLSSPAMGFGILLIPLMDTLRVFAIRIFHGRSPFSPDRNHIHHWLIDRGMSHRSITLTLSVAAILFIIFTYLALPLGTTKVIVLQILAFFAGIYALYLTHPKPKMKVVSDEEEKESFVKKIFYQSFAGNE
ncbi:MAG: undecaprenyl/decaprenyl-phosphate alpha-N-acetylglucosaminyl 1-phosphate transferase [Sphingobacteriia bacterium]|nr:undecaprenyl/decaprenyl-phosphate alpha-N-acetylglucosaminyl 1-phosphate transferase [Sphingobacteriia bacterium]